MGRNLTVKFIEAENRAIAATYRDPMVGAKAVRGEDLPLPPCLAARMTADQTAWPSGQLEALSRAGW
ncbi:MAG: hypothetical protein KGK01_01655 [Bradyrhizobium sp.]|uniref:hypothetical protein n=1 Tax=Bradyrhizobium sp. TaxID=376 RepID=UPI001C2843F2|nr:hypothetical protein [Bradyrhizobium sp.]MBU6464164.1 hypothetical protein [Pseudomonadota bacterium]MDE2066970.1 hypothetical protein [Bradyrhizobium sp.]MDE2241171.1 hypothetical protein [Bradyrhizobium sp.]MDE2469878.1 hypothetical protein [Bradyrhizobium sp.]